MPKLNLNPEFTDSDAPDAVETEETAEDIDSEEDNELDDHTDDDQDGEDETPADTSEAKKTGEEDEDEEDSEEDSEEDDSEDDDEDDTPPADAAEKKRVLDGLLATERELDGNLTDIDREIEEARKRIVEKRGQRRDKRGIKDIVHSTIPPESNDDDLSDVDPDNIELIERVIKAKGFVKKEDLQKQTYEETHKSAQDAFFSAHPEYLPKNDPDDKLYNAILEELSLFATPKDAKLIPKLFTKAHEQVVKRFPNRFTTKKTIPQKNAIVARTRRASMGGGSSGGGNNPAPKNKNNGTGKLSAAQKQQMLHGGWTEEEINSIDNS